MKRSAEVPRGEATAPRGWYGRGNPPDYGVLVCVCVLSAGAWMAVVSHIRLPNRELFGAVILASLVVVTAWHAARNQSGEKEDHAWFLAFLTAAGAVLVAHVHAWNLSGDFHVYVAAAKALASGQDPYALQDVPGRYLYPPLFGQILVLIFRTIDFGTRISGFGPSNWYFVFHAYQYLQFLSSLLLAAGLIVFGRHLGLGIVASTALAAAGAAFSVPAVDGLRWNQINPAVAALTVWGVLFAARRPILAGALLATAVNMKLYTVLVLPALLVSRRWKVAAWFAGLSLLLVVLQAALSGGLDTMLRFLQTLTETGARTGLPRHDLPKQTSVVALLLYFPGPVLLYRTLAGLIGIGLFAAAIRRALVRERAFRAGGSEQDGSPDTSLYGHFADAVAVMLLASPIVWAHHYILAAPMIMWTVAVTSGRRLLWVVCASILVLGTYSEASPAVGALRPAALLALFLLVPATAKPEHEKAQ